MSSDEIVISAHGLSKFYPLYDRPEDRLKQAIVPRLQGLIGHKPHTYFRKFWALSNVSFDVRKGETVGIIGRNGSGKSTLLQIICGTLRPSTGSLTTSGRIAALLELGSGFNPEFTGQENVYMNGAILGMTQAEIAGRFDDIAAFADLGDFMQQPVKSYSSGMYVRLAFAVAIHVNPDILIVDEALSVGDFAFQVRCMRRIKQFLETGGSLLFVSHDIGMVKSLCERSLYLRRGQAVDFGPSDRVAHHYLDDVHRDEGLAGPETASVPETAPLAAASPGISEATAAAFRDAVATHIRASSGDCEFVSAEVLDANGGPVALAGWGDELSVRTRLRVLRPLPEICVAIYIRDRVQSDLIGTNTMYEGCPLKNLRPGDEVTLSFEFKNFLRAGRYGVCLIAGDRPGDTRCFYDWIDLATSFACQDRPGKQAWALFNPGIRVAASLQHVSP